MTVLEIKERVMFQTNNDATDVGDFEPHLVDYINEGYDLLLYAALGVHAGDDDYPLLEDDEDTPVDDIPVRVHNALADYATYRVYLNGSAQKQSRGYVYLSSFNRIKSNLSESLAASTITNIPE